MNNENAQKSSERVIENLSDSRSRSRNFCFTSFDVEKPKFDEMTMKYLCFGSEIAPTTGTHHWQGFVCWKNAKTISACKKNLINNGRVFIIKGTLKQNEEYCTKEGKFEKFGTLPNQGKRRDLIELKDALINGETTVEEILIENPETYHQYGRTLEKIESIAQRSNFRTEMTKCDWIYGTTGTGKSEEAFTGYDPNTHYLWSDDKGWWDGYKGQEVVIMNDFRGEIPYNFMLQLVDKWPVNVRRRNREPVPFTSKKIIITSSLKPDEIYHNRNDEDKIEQLLRRITIKEKKRTPMLLSMGTPMSVAKQN